MVLVVYLRSGVYFSVMSIIWAVLGAVAGSVANAVIDRLPRRESWFTGRSKCDKCKHELGVVDLVPVLSYLSLGGKCRYCRKPIAVRNLLVELSMIFGFLALSTWPLALIFWVTVVIAVMDFETMLVSDWLVGLWFVLTLFTMNYELITMNLLGAAVAVGVIGGLWVLTKKRGMGDGDIGIAAVMGYWLGWPRVAPALWISFVAGAVYGLWLIVHSRAKMKSQIPFGPFLIIGAWIGYVWGDKFIKMFF